ncbi:protein-L-isoaspartate O-methyltransferase family protein [Mangrovibrevibacter kandeliae]|uniref:protein-L-isoaspartate O-methyltransferase family protein n=1 Tax=Mangrovibrevibacter kandeliae TaxID=2968473 RepID=UPI002118E964|nr:protein-L-isoaspartate O-methyltransferase [Aurantimonas sp. CSK15Z-1]MCQ8781745.1 protein-L-isoaspartate O-methyltransferase [Aurantimonas sp. CSK15Z-1]
MDYAAARTKMVDNQIRTTDVTDHAILRAFLSVPREDFVPDARRPLAYIDGDVALGGGRYLMEPSPFAKLIQLAQIGPGDVVLDVGSGSGYSSAILSQLAGSVVALESDAQLSTAATETLARLDYLNCVVVQSPLEAGYASEAPYDVILFEGAVDAVPSCFFDQLRSGGRLVAVVGTGNAASARLFRKEGETVSDRFAFNCSIRGLPGFESQPDFVF